MNEIILKELSTELSVLLKNDSVVVKCAFGKIMVFPSDDDGKISSIFPICQPTIEKIADFCCIKNLFYFVALDVITNHFCFSIFKSDK